MILHLRAWASPRHILLLLLAITLLKGLAWSIIVPPWHAPDENTHFMYGQMIERFSVLHPTPSIWVNGEINVSWDLAQIHPVRFDPSKYLDLSHRKTIAEKIARVGSPELKRAYVYNERKIFPFFYSFTFSHPPLYYFLTGALQATLEDHSILVRILAARWLSVVLGVALTALAFQVGKIIFQSDAWGLLSATLVAFHPTTSFMTAVINNNALEIVLFSACVLVLLLILREGLSTRRALVLGVLLGASLLTRVSLFSLLPLVLVALFWNIYSLRHVGKLNGRALAPWLWVAVIPPLIAGWWYVDVFKQIAQSLTGELSDSSFDPISNNQARIFSYDWITTGARIAENYWGNFGWLDTPLPAPLANTLIGLSLVAIALTAVWVIRHWGAESRIQIPQPSLILFLGLAILAVFIFYFGLDLTVGFGLQGRYFLPPIIAQMIWLALGITALTPARWRAAVMWLLGAGMIALNLFSLFSVIALRYYGARNLLLVVDRATVLQPVPAPVLFILIAIYFLALALFVPAFWRVLTRESLPAL